MSICTATDRPICIIGNTYIISTLYPTAINLNHCLIKAELAGIYRQESSEGKLLFAKSFSPKYKINCSLPKLPAIASFLASISSSLCWI
jgi:hypothetical protein